MTLPFAPLSLPAITTTVSPFFTFMVRADRKSTRLNSSHSQISYAVFCLKKKKQIVSRAESAGQQPAALSLRPHAAPAADVVPAFDRYDHIRPPSLRVLQLDMAADGHALC